MRMDVLAGLGSLGFSDAQIRNAYYDTLSVSWSSVIAAAGNREESVRNGTGGHFVITSQIITAWVPTPSASAVNGTGFALQYSATKASNTWYGYDHLGVSMRFNSRQIGGNSIPRASSWFRGPDGPRYFPYAQPVVNPSESLFVKLYNESGESILAEAFFEGMVIPA